MRQQICCQSCIDVRMALPGISTVFIDVEENFYKHWETELMQGMFFIRFSSRPRIGLGLNQLLQ